MHLTYKIKDLFDWSLSLAIRFAVFIYKSEWEEDTTTEKYTQPVLPEQEATLRPLTKSYQEINHSINHLIQRDSKRTNSKVKQSIL